MFLILLLLFSLNLFTSSLADPLPERRNLPIVKYADNESGFRLRNDTVPFRYGVELTTRIHEGDFNFTGHVVITLKAVEETTQIQVHYRQIEFDKIEFYDNKGNEVQILSWNNDSEHDFLNILLNEEDKLIVDELYTLSIEYHGILREDNQGFYRSSYVDENGNTRWLATTQFESTDARHAFPCYDEPGLRAPIRILITYHESYSAISNMPGKILGDPDENGMVTIRFDELRAVQPYLVSFIISDYNYVANIPTNGPYTRVFSRPEAIKANETDAALECAVAVLWEQENYFNSSYDLPKVDHVSIPDFAAGAMENWGLITYREEYLLYNPKRHSLDVLNEILLTISHELAHQWFGNKVAPLWWSYVWLNEGFATLYEYLSTHAVYPHLRNNELIVLRQNHRAFGTDALESTRPMTHYVEHPDSIEGLFDDIAYSKAGSVLRMWLHALGEDTFVKGLSYYLNEMALKAAESDDLARNLQKAADEKGLLPSDITMKSIVDSWSRKAGYPVLNVERAEDKLIVTQERFLLKSNAAVGSETWHIPYNLATASSPDFSNTLASGWIRESQKTVEIDLKAVTWTSNDWIILNKQQFGYYRVNYDASGWQLIISQLLSGNLNPIHVINRAQLIDDVFNLARSGRQSYETAFDLAQYLKQEMEYLPWGATNNAFNYLNRMLAASPSYKDFITFVQEYVTPLYEQMGVENSPNHVYFDALKRNVAIEWACLSGNEDCLNQTSSRLKEALDDPATKEIEPDLKRVIYCNGLRSSSREDWTRVWNKMISNDDQTDRSILLNALGCSQEEDTLKYYLDTSIDQSVNYRRSERNVVLSSVYTSGARGLELAIEFLSNNHVKVNELYNGGNPTLSACLGISTRIASEEQRESFDALLTKLVSFQVVTQTARTQMLDTSRENLSWLEENIDEIHQYFERYFRSSAATVMLSVVLLTLSVFVNNLLQ